MDDYAYYDTTNRLKNINPAAGNTYQYDAIGNLIADNSEGVDITWTPYGKVHGITKGDTVAVTFRYDASGNRVEKKVVKGDTTTITRYVRDASGNVMGIYADTTLREQSVYGSSRLGIYRRGLAHRTLGGRNYELSNHLGNVMVVITDEVGTVTSSGGQEDFDAGVKVVAANDYYPFGLAMQGRSYSDTTYRYGFNGKEKDENGEFGGTHYDYGFRIYNPRISKFLSVDPLILFYPMLTPFQFASNSPIAAIDLDGLESFVTISRQAEDCGFNTELNTPYIDDIEAAQGAINNAIKEYPKAFEGIKPEDGVNIFLDSKGDYIGAQRVPGILVEDEVGFVDALSDVNVFGKWIEKNVGKPVYDLRDATKQFEFGVEIKVIATRYHTFLLNNISREAPMPAPAFPCAGAGFFTLVKSGQIHPTTSLHASVYAGHDVNRHFQRSCSPRAIQIGWWPIMFVLPSQQ